MILRNIHNDYRCSRIPSKLSVYKDHRNYHVHDFKMSKIVGIMSKNRIDMLHIDYYEESIVNNGFTWYGSSIGLSFEGSSAYNSSMKKYKLKLKYGKNIL